MFFITIGKHSLSDKSMASLYLKEEFLGANCYEHFYFKTFSSLAKENPFGVVVYRDIPGNLPASTNVPRVNH